MEKLISLHEQIVIELLESREINMAKEILRSTVPMNNLKVENPERFAKLEQLCQRPVFSSAEAYEIGMSREKRRQEIADMLSSEICVVPQSRLLSVIGQALKYQQSQGLLPQGESIDLFRGGKRSVRKDQEEKFPRKQAGVIKFNPESHPETVLFSPDGVSLLTGSVDGFVELWDFETCRLRKDLEYQANDELMLHEESILCSAFNKDGQLLATGSRDGMVKVWKVSSGQCLRKFERAHSQGIATVAFSKDSASIVTGSFDNFARIHGLKSGKTLKEFRYDAYNNIIKIIRCLIVLLLID
jgi:WD40 repeat-containing protein SMU1